MKHLLCSGPSVVSFTSEVAEVRNLCSRPLNYFVGRKATKKMLSDLDYFGNLNYYFEIVLDIWLR